MYCARSQGERGRAQGIVVAGFLQLRQCGCGGRGEDEVGRADSGGDLCCWIGEWVRAR